MSRRTRVWLALVAVAVLVAGACGSGDGGDGAKGGSSAATSMTAADGSSGREGEIVAQVASYELLAGRPQRFLTGLVVSGKGTVVSFGSVGVEFFYLGTKDEPIDPPQPKSSTTAQFLPVSGQGPPGAGAGGPGGEPQIVRPSQGVGVYKADGVQFDQPGYWGARVTAKVDGKDVKADAAFEVKATPSIPAPGMPAPRTENPTVATSAAGAADRSLDSRAGADSPLPDAELHDTTIASAIATGKPLVVVVSTPVYCVSKFCGPVTESVAALAKGAYKGKVAFVHLEVWKDFEAKQINPAAGEWIQQPSGDAQEPWVFTVGRDGVIVDRFDNVASDAELDAAVQRLLA